MKHFVIQVMIDWDKLGNVYSVEDQDGSRYGTFETEKEAINFKKDLEIQEQKHNFETP